MKLTKQLIPFTPNGVDQRSEKSQVPPGRMIAAENVHQPYGPGTLSKRNGFALMDRIADNDPGSLEDGRDLSSTGTALVARTADGIYLRGADMWLRRSPLPPVQSKPPLRALPYGYKPSMIEA